MPQEFVVEGWKASGNLLSLHYRADSHSFTETLEFPVEIDLTPSLSHCIDLLAIVSSVSYLKAFVPAHLNANDIALTPSSLDLVRAVCDDGLREFAYENHLSIPVDVDITAGEARSTTQPAVNAAVKPLIPLGGGKDSCVVLSALHHLSPTLLSIGENPYSANVARVAGLPLHVVKRTIDPHLLELNAAGALNGHVPITAINSLISIITAELLGCTDVVMANESSSSEPTRTVNGYSINHQYSKSFACENLLREAISSCGSPVNYFSALRNRGDAEISRAFANANAALHGVFMSCNRAMVRDPQKRSNGWCTQCPKCRSVYLSLAPHMSPSQLANIFRSDLLNDADQIDGFQDLISSDVKPFECVSDIAHASESMHILASHPEWRDHVVVRALSGNPVVASTWNGADDSVNTNIPVAYRTELDKVFYG